MATTKTAKDKKTTDAPENIIDVEIRYIPDDKLGVAWVKAQLGDTAGFLPIADLELVDTPGFSPEKRAVNHPRNLETIYRTFQSAAQADAQDRVGQLRRRAMSVGDAIVIDEVGYYVTNSGFATRNEDGSLTPVVA